MTIISKYDLIAKRKKYHKKYYQKNRNKLLQRQKTYEKARRKKFEEIKPLLNTLYKGITTSKKGYKGFQKKTGKFIVKFD